MYCGVRYYMHLSGLHSTIQKIFYAAVKSSLVRATKIPKLWCEADLHGMVWGRTWTLVDVHDDLLTNFTTVRQKANEQAVDGSHKDIKICLGTRRFADLKTMDTHFDVEQHFFYEMMGGRGGELAQQKLLELFPAAGIEKQPSLLLAQIDALRETPLSKFTGEAMQEESQEVRKMIYATTRGHVPKILPNPIGGHCWKQYSEQFVLK